jgi:hypothetical protein
MTASTAPMEWLDDVIVDVTELDLMVDLDPGWLVWDAEPVPSLV